MYRFCSLKIVPTEYLQAKLFPASFARAFGSLFDLAISMPVSATTDLPTCTCRGPRHHDRLSSITIMMTPVRLLQTQAGSAQSKINVYNNGKLQAIFASREIIRVHMKYVDPVSR
jgi:hypothetical protein